jgi:hypothetical protein
VAMPSLMLKEPLRLGGIEERSMSINIEDRRTAGPKAKRRLGDGAIIALSSILPVFGARTG